MSKFGNQEGSPMEYCQGYSTNVDAIREQEYPLLNGMEIDTPSRLSFLEPRHPGPEFSWIGTDQTCSV